MISGLVLFIYHVVLSIIAKVTIFVEGIED